MKFLAIIVVSWYVFMILFGFAVMTVHMDMDVMSYEQTFAVNAFEMIAHHAAFLATLVGVYSIASTPMLLLALVVGAFSAVFFRRFFTHKNFLSFLFLRANYLQESLYLFTRTALQLLRRWFARLSLSPTVFAQR